MIIRPFVTFVLGGSLLAGCALPGPGTARPVAGGAFTLTDKNRSGDRLENVKELSTTPADPVKGTISGVKVNVFAVSVPRGAVSANETFWKRVDEDALVDRLHYDLLFANGFRVGIARADQWEYFREVLSTTPALSENMTVGVVDEAALEVPVRKGVDEQQLSFFAPGEPVELKTYRDSDNLFSLSFVAAPRRSDACRVALTPVVRSTKERLDYTVTNDEVRIKIAVTERMYPLNLTAEIPFGQFLVVSPSTDVARNSSIGRNFLVLDDDAEQHELVLLIVPSKAEYKPLASPTAKNKK